MNPIPLLAPVRLLVLVAPRTKKNSGQIQNRGKRRIVKPSDAWLEFRDLAVPQLRSQWAQLRLPPISATVNVCARFYLDGDWRSDVQGYYESLADVLKVDKGRGAGIVLDDNRHIIASWDGSRVLVDRDRPRVEILIEPARFTIDKGYQIG